MTVPVNTTAKIYVPCAEGTVISESGVEASTVEGVSVLGRDSGCTVYKVGSGRYTFRSFLTE